jgi:hypothetical protein
MGTLTKAIIFFKECQLIVSRQHKAPRQETLKHEIRTFDQLRQTPQTNSNAITSIKIPTSEKREIAKKHFIQKKRKTSFKTDSNDGFTRTVPFFCHAAGRVQTDRFGWRSCPTHPEPNPTKEGGLARQSELFHILAKVGH